MATRTKRTRLLAALLCALLVALMLPALPTVGYAASDTVVYLSNSGDDANDGSTQALAVKTLDRALALADGGTIICLLYTSCRRYLARSRGKRRRRSGCMNSFCRR